MRRPHAHTGSMHLVGSTLCIQGTGSLVTACALFGQWPDLLPAPKCEARFAGAVLWPLTRQKPPALAL